MFNLQIQSRLIKLLFSLTLLIPCWFPFLIFVIFFCMHKLLTMPEMFDRIKFVFPIAFLAIGTGIEFTLLSVNPMMGLLILLGGVLFTQFCSFFSNNGKEFGIRADFTHGIIAYNYSDYTYSQLLFRLIPAMFASFGSFLCFEKYFLINLFEFSLRLGPWQYYFYFTIIAIIATVTFIISVAMLQRYLKNNYFSPW